MNRRSKNQSRRALIHPRRGLFAGLAGLLALLATAATANVPLPITYQGLLEVDQVAVDGTVDLEFVLFDASVNGAQMSPALTFIGHPVSNGVISVGLSFPADVYTGAPLWLEVGVREGNSSGAFNILGPRVPLRAVPYAHRASHAATADEAQNAAMLNNMTSSEFAEADHRHSSLSPEGSSLQVLRAIGEGRVNLSPDNGVDLGMDFFTNDLGNLRLLRPEGAGQGLYIDATVNGKTVISALADNANQTLELQAGGLVPNLDGGNLRLKAGDASTSFEGGRVFIEAGNKGPDGGIDGDVNVQGRKINFRRANPADATPLLDVEGDVYLTGRLLKPESLSISFDIGGLFVLDETEGAFLNMRTARGNTSMDLRLGKLKGGVITIGPETPSLFDTNIQNGESLTVTAASGRLSGSGGGGDLRLEAGRGSGSFLGTPVGGKGGNVFITSGSATGTGSWNGGDVRIVAGTGRNSGRAGAIMFETPRIRIGDAQPPAAGRVIDTTSGAHLTSGGAWTNSSDAALKTEYSRVDPREVLHRLLSLPVSKFRYIAEEEGTMRLGPTAQDFHTAFGLGNTDKAIATVDADGVAFAAIQGLHQETNQRMSELEAENAALRSRLELLEAKLNEVLGSR